MHICLVINAELPVNLYGGTERVVYALGRSLVDLGHKVTFISKTLKLDFADTIILDASKSLDSQIPKSVDIVHLHSDMEMPAKFYSCKTIHGNTRHKKIFHKNSIFVSKNHAKNHGGEAYVYNGIDGRDYGTVNFETKRDSFIFLAKASWKIKNLKGAIDVTKRAKSSINILGGYRFNFKQGMRFTLTSRAKFHGMVNDQQKNYFLQRGKGLIFPVLWPEPFGLAVIESFYFGIPVFATPYGSLPELVNSDVGFLSNSCSELAMHAECWETYDRKLIHNHWKQFFSAEVMAKNYLNFYSKILNGQSLHRYPVHSDSVRSSKLMKWII